MAIALSLNACSPGEEKAGDAPEPAAETASAPTSPPEAPVANPIALAITDAVGAQMSGDPAREQRVFAQCASCHSVDEGMNRVGPSLHGIVGALRAV